MTTKISKDSSKTFEDVESDDFSQETSAATDYSLSPDDNFEREERREKKRRLAKRLAKRKQLFQAIHDLQLLKVDRAQKNMVIDSLRSEHAQHIEEFEERLNDLTYQKQILQARLETEVQSEQQEAKKRQQTISRELELVKTKQQHLEAVNERLLEKAGHVRRSLRDLNLSREQYCQLKGLPEGDLSLRDYIAIRMYNTVHPLQTEIDQLRITGRAQDEQISSYADELQQLKWRLEDEHAKNAELHVKLQKLEKASKDHADCGAQVKTIDCKAVSYEQIKDCREEDARNGQLEAEKQLRLMENDNENLRMEKDQLTRQLSTAQQSEALLKQDKDYLCRQVSESTKHLEFTEDRLQQVTRQLDDARKAREEVYEKYVTSRDKYKLEYEKKLQEELDKIRASTNAEMEHLRTSTKDMYERENRDLRGARDAALAERDRYQVSVRETNMKYEELTTQLRDMQSKAENLSSELQNELKVKVLEAERSQMVCEETQNSLKDKAMDVELLQKKEETLKKEYYTMQTLMEKRIVELETQLSERNSKLNVYERLEQELDQVIVQAAETTDDKAAERVMVSYANVPSTAKRRMEQSVQLAKQVLQLERDNSALHKDIDEERNKVGKLTNMVEKSKTTLEQVQQPYSYLISGIQERDEQISQLQEHIDLLEQELRQTCEEKKKLMQTQNQMSQDLKRLLREREDNAMLKQAVTNMTARQRGQVRTVGCGEGGPFKTGSLKSTPRTQSPSHNRSNLVERHNCGIAPPGQSTHAPPVQAAQWKKKARKAIPPAQKQRGQTV